MRYDADFDPALTEAAHACEVAAAVFRLSCRTVGATQIADLLSSRDESGA